MNAYRRIVTLTEPGKVVVEGLPLKSGARVEVVVLADERREPLTAGQRASLAEEMRALFKRTQALPHVQELTEEDIAHEIAEYRAGR